MADRDDPSDPFLEGDPSAAEREARRREREQRRAKRDRGEETRRSLGERVRDAIPAPPPAEHTAPAPDAPSEKPPAPPAAEHEGREAAPIGGDDPEPASDSREFFAQPRRLPGLDRGREAGGRLGKEIMRRRLLAAAAVLGFVVVIVVIARAAGGGDEPTVDSVAVEPVETQSLTIPEGLTLDQIGKLAKKAKLKGGYDKAARKAPKGFPMKRYGAADAQSLEGFLFPATYELEKRAKATALVSKQLDAFMQNISQVDLSEAKKRNLTTYDVLKIASMIEREVSVPEERRLVAAVIYNRLGDGEPLGIDATLRYELDDFDSPLLESELSADTPYNTRINAGLPPTPIGNPGLASIEAAADPANKDFRFYVIKPGTCNEHVFTADSAEFEKARAKYQAALEAEGGSPTDCG